MKKYIYYIMATILLIFFSIKESYPYINIIDLKDRKIYISYVPKRIICLGPGALRLIVYLNAQNKVVGIEDVEKRYPNNRPYIIAHPELLKLPSCGPGGAASINKKPDLEKIISLKPDVIFVTYMDGDLANEVQSILGIPVVILDYGGFATVDENVYKSLLIAGKILNKGTRANGIIHFINSIKQDLNNRTLYGIKEKRLSAYVGGIGYRGTHGIESTERKYLPFDWTNVKNIAKSIKPTIGTHVFLDKEVLLKLNPDIIFLDCGGLSIIEHDFYKKSPFYMALQAFRAKRVYTLLPFNWYATNIGTVLVDAYAVGKILYPDKFKDIILSKKANDIYEYFLGKKIYRKIASQYSKLNTIPDFIK